MKLNDLIETTEFDQPVQSEADKLRNMQTKIKSLAHHRAILMPIANELQDLSDAEIRAFEKMTPAQRQKQTIVQAKLKHIDTQLKQFNIVIGKSKIANPLAQCEFALYAGPPEQYPDLTTSQVKLFNEIQGILKRTGILPLTLLYGGRRSKSYPGINFVAVNADKTFAWRKYDPSPGSGQNWIYIAGVRQKGGGLLKTSDFIKSPYKYLHKK